MLFGPRHCLNSLVQTVTSHLSGPDPSSLCTSHNLPVGVTSAVKRKRSLRLHTYSAKLSLMEHRAKLRTQGNAKI